MAYNRPGVGNYFGFQPVQGAHDGGQIITNPYVVSSSEATSIMIGDVCVWTSLGTVKVATGALSSAMAGVAASRHTAGDGSTSLFTQGIYNAQSSKVVMLWDSPNQLFLGCDSSSGLIGTTGILKFAAVLTTGVVGSTGPNTTLGRSVMALGALSTQPMTASSSGLTYQGGPFKILGIHPMESGFSSAAPGTGNSTDVRKFILQPVLSLQAAWTGAATT